MSRIATEELRRLLAESEGDNYALAFRAAGRLGEISPEIAAEVLRLRDALESAIDSLNTIDSECEKRSRTELGDIARLGKWDARERAALSAPAPVMDAVKQGDARDGRA